MKGRISNKENELNEVKTINSTLNDNDSYESDMVEKVMITTIKILDVAPILLKQDSPLISKHAYG